MIRGVFCAAATPLNADLSPDLCAFAAHARALIDDGCDGIALLGTTGEANSFSLAERRAILEAGVAAVGPARLMPGTGVNALPETVELTRHALSLGVTRVVMLPPSYYKGVTDEGLFRAYAQVIETIADDRLQVVLYHIPQVSGVPISHDLIARLVAAFPQTVVGIKDSAGKIENMQAMIARFPGFSVLAGADPLLLPLMGMGGAGASPPHRTLWPKVWPRCSATMPIPRNRLRCRRHRRGSTPFATCRIPMSRSPRSRRWSRSGMAWRSGPGHVRRWLACRLPNWTLKKTACARLARP